MNLSIGQILGIYPIKKKLNKVYQYKSKLDSTWKDCKSEWDMLQYKKYMYEIRIIHK